ncbi:prion-inhibition and propagation-domain-containing protein [Xylaria acuta]|nr:prion-inhibition and propagation-domain-containing protein [Xylaria acuta]
MAEAGLILSTVSLIFQVFSGCVQGYQLFSEAKGLEVNHQFLRIRFKTEQYRLLDWADIAGLSEDDATLVINQAMKPHLLDILDQQYRLMLRFGRVDERLRPLVKPFIQEERDDLDDRQCDEERLTNRFPTTRPLYLKALKYIQATTKHPVRIRWAISDKSKVEDILFKLTTLNDSLHQLFTSQQLQILQDNIIRTNYQIVQMNQRFEHLCQLIEADLLLGTNTAAQTQPVPSRGTYSRLASLAKFKGFKSAVEEGALDETMRTQLRLDHSLNQPQPMKLSSADIQLIDEKVYAEWQRTPAWYKCSLAPWKRVWIEWTSTKVSQTMAHKNSEPLILKRFENLVCLLRENELTAQFHALQCHGYYLRHSQFGVQYGLVFESPPDANAESDPISLFDLLHEDGVPSLGARLALVRVLTEAVEKLHAVNWLHKGLRSQNILFFADSADKVDFSMPFLSGFEYSRPDSADYLSESPPAIAAEDLYRHPSVQGGLHESGHGFGYKKQYDIYSLGILILEIAYWKPVYQILGYRSAQLIKPSETTRVKEVLLSGKYGKKISAYMGDVVSEVWRASLMGPASFGVLEDDSDAVMGARLQEKFFELFVKRLQQLHI